MRSENTYVFNLPRAKKDNGDKSKDECLNIDLDAWSNMDLI